jgi:hypothetical protein
MKFHNVEQNTDEWLQLRAGKVTGSGISKIMANEGKAFGQPAKDYAVQIALERIIGEPRGNNYSNGHMERGHEQEPLARAAYEDEFFCDISGGGFFDCGNEGCSPDGLIGDSGIIEIKSCIYNIHYKNVKRDDIDPAYKWQLYFNLQKTERDWIDYVSYCHDYPQGKKLFTRRVHANECGDVFTRMDSRLLEFEKLVDESKNNILRETF